MSKTTLFSPKMNWTITFNKSLMWLRASVCEHLCMCMCVSGVRTTCNIKPTGNEREKNTCTHMNDVRFLKYLSTSTIYVIDRNTESPKPKCNRFAPKIVTQMHVYLYEVRCSLLNTVFVRVKQFRFIRQSMIRFCESVFVLFFRSSLWMLNRFSIAWYVSQRTSLWYSQVPSHLVKFSHEIKTNDNKTTFFPCCIQTQTHRESERESNIFSLLAIYHQKQCEMCIQAIGFPQKAEKGM